MSDARRPAAPAEGGGSNLSRRSVVLGLAAASTASVLPLGHASAGPLPASRFRAAALAQEAADGYPTGAGGSELEPIGTRGGELIEIARGGEADTADPLLSNSIAANDRRKMVFSSLVAPHPDTGLPYGDLATEVPSLENGGISDDGLTYTFALRPNVTWHDGQPFTARDVVFTYELAANEAYAARLGAQLRDYIESVTAPDDLTVVFNLTRVNVKLFTLLEASIVPEHILKDVPPDAIREHAFALGDPAATVGTGPFKYQEWIRDDRAVFVKNADYFRGEPALDKITSKAVKDLTVAAQQLKTGEADLGQITAAQFEEFSAVPDVGAISFETDAVVYLAFQLDEARSRLFLDPRVRHAMAHAVDRDTMIQAVRFGLSTKAVGILAPTSWAYQPEKIETAYPYDPARSEQLLDEAGWLRGDDGIRAKDGERLSFTLWTYAGEPELEQYVTILQQLFAQIGVEASPKTEETRAFVERFATRHDFDCFLSYFGGMGSDPDLTFWFATSSYPEASNRPRYSNPEADALMAEGLGELDRERRMEISSEIENILMEDLPYFFMEYPQRLVGVNNRFHNYRGNLRNDRWNIQTWWVD